MAIEHRLSDALQMRIDKDTYNNTIIEIEFKFIRYRLKLDDEEKTRKLVKLMLDSLKKQQRVVQPPDKLPSFYNSKESESPL